MERGLTYTKQITIVTETCCSCGIAFGLPSDFRGVCLNNPQKSFYCPNGHSMSYAENKEDRLRKEAEARLAQAEDELKKKREQLADADTVKAIMQKQIDSAARKLKRVHNGVCTCCNRSFTNLRRHIETKHPELVKGRNKGILK